MSTAVPSTDGRSADRRRRYRREMEEVLAMGVSKADVAKVVCAFHAQLPDVDDLRAALQQYVSPRKLASLEKERQYRRKGTPASVRATGSGQHDQRIRECPTCGGTGRIAMPGSPPPSDTMGRRLYDLFAERGLSQAAVGAILGRTQPAISLWLSGGRRPQYDDLCRIADLFDTTTDYLLGRTQDRNADRPER